MTGRGPATLLLLALAATAFASDAFTEADEAPTGAPASAPKSRLLPIPPLPKGPPPTGALPQALVDAAIAARDLPLPARIVAVTQPMLGVPYKLDGLGEGEGYDPDPLARYDAFDCIGFVEEAYALAMAGDPVHAAEIRTRMRYGAGPVDYAHRRHFMELQWLPGNVADGFIVDTTSAYGPTTRMEREVTPDTWKRWRKRSAFHLTDDELPMGTMRLDVLGLDDAIAAAQRLPDGALIATVRKDVGTPLWITHTGLVAHDAEGRAVQRNASRRSGMAVVDEDLVRYLKHLKTYANWPAVGIAVFEPRDPWPRRTALGPPPAPGETP